MPTHLVPDLDHAIAHTRASLAGAIADGDEFPRLMMESARVEVRMLLPDLDPRTPPAALGAALIAAASHAASVVAIARAQDGIEGDLCKHATLAVNVLTSFAVAFIELGEEQDAAAAGGDGR